jgi:hypothetical protein
MDGSDFFSSLTEFSNHLVTQVAIPDHQKNESKRRKKPQKPKVLFSLLKNQKVFFWLNSGEPKLSNFDLKKFRNTFEHT